MSRYDNHIFSARSFSPEGGITTHIRFVPEKKENFFAPAITQPVTLAYTVWQWVSLAGGVALLVSSYLLPKSYEMLEKAMQAVGLLMVAAVGKEFFGLWVRKAWNSQPMRELRDMFREGEAPQ